MATPGVDPELEAARAAGLIPDPLAVAMQQIGGPAPPAPKLLGIADQTHTPLPPPIATAPAVLDTTRATARSAPATGPAVELPLPAGVPPQAEANAAAQRAAEAAAIRVGPDTKVSGMDAKSKAAIRAKEIEFQRNDKAKAETIGQGTELAAEKANEVALDEEEKKLDRAALEYNQAEERAQLEAAKVAAQDEAKRLRSDLAKDYERGFFETQGTAKTWLGAISIGLGAFAANWNKTPNFAWQIMEKAMDDHAAREKARLLRKKDEIERAGGDAKEARQALLDYDRITRPQQEAALLTKAAERRARLLSRYGADEERIKGDQLLQRAREEALVREMNVAQGLASKVEVDNSEQQKLRRTAALAAASPTGQPDKPYAKLDGAEQKAQAVINGALTATKNAAKLAYSAKDVKAIGEMVSAARNVDPSDPVKFWSALTQIKGKHFSQLSEAGKERFSSWFRAAQDLERITSGAVIGTNEIADFLSASTKPGNEGMLIQRARDMLPATGQPTAVGARIDAAASELGIAGGGRAAAPATKSAPSAAAVRAEAIELLRSPNLSAKDRAAVDAARANPGHPAAAKALEIARRKVGN